MITLTNTDKIQVQLGEAAGTQLDCYTSLTERGTGVKKDGVRHVVRTNNTNVVDIVDAPTVSTVQRLVDSISIYNNDSISHIVSIIFNTGSATGILDKKTVPAGGKLQYEDKKGWDVINNLGQSLTNSILTLAPFCNTKLISGALYETFDRDMCDEVNTSVLSSGRLSLQAIFIPAGITINSISLWSATTAGASLTNQLFGLYDNNLNLLRSSVNDTASGLWAANSKKTLALTSAFTTNYSGLYYIGVMIAGTTVPTLKGNTGKTGGQLNNAAPALSGTSNTGLTNALPNPANAPGLVTTSFWACVN